MISCFLTQLGENLFVAQNQFIIGQRVKKCLPPGETISLVEAFSLDDPFESFHIGWVQEHLENHSLENVVDSESVFVFDGQVCGLKEA